MARRRFALTEAKEEAEEEEAALFFNTGDPCSFVRRCRGAGMEVFGEVALLLPFSRESGFSPAAAAAAASSRMTPLAWRSRRRRR